MFSTYIFDIDGTLINTEEAVLGSLQKMLKVHFNRNVDRHDLTFVLGIPGAVSLPQLGIADFDLGNRYWNNYMTDYRQTIHVFEGIQQLLSTLKELSITTGVVTSKTNQEFQNDFVPFGLAHNLPHIVCADDTKLHKPHPEPLLKFLQISGAREGSSLYIGDTIYDYECARDAGVEFGLALWGCKQPDLIPAKFKFEHPKDVLSLLNPQ
ncbi:HAD family hydrolase [Paenibacillus polymyxa]|uniref:HAD family hydrolase n=1 Tax=Paenibacillus TaxID=44249 RepID=UPI000F4F33E3|nr:MULTISPECIES: HAD family hydrolase [Paenibacillus]KAF6655215.1 HAD family hydrolase [Paenibacillus sp. EKM301P]RPE03953.1 HAD family hydrolase [Paenibacillus polymyxa]UBS89556.1 HAD family hydrolase [Paenibacillus polymyxa]WHX33459.1 HAD family hydrolase [Paenibacillus polymyxa]